MTVTGSIGPQGARSTAIVQFSVTCLIFFEVNLKTYDYDDSKTESIQYVLQIQWPFAGPDVLSMKSHSW